MTYLAASDLTNALGADLVLRLLDDDNDGTADAAPLAAVLADTDAVVNGYATRVYSVAAIVAAQPAIVTKLAKDVAVHLAYLRRPEFRNERGETPVQKQYDDAIRMLKDVGDGKLRLDVDGTPGVPANAGTGGIRTGTYGNQVPVGEGFIKDDLTGNGF